jgi:hypothetical protein
MIPSNYENGALLLQFQDLGRKQVQFADQPPDGCEELCVSLCCDHVRATCAEGMACGR